MQRNEVRHCGVTIVKDVSEIWKERIARSVDIV